MENIPITTGCSTASVTSDGSVSFTSGPDGKLSAARPALSAAASSPVQMASNRARHSSECAPVPKAHLVQSGVRPHRSNVWFVMYSCLVTGWSLSDSSVPEGAPALL